MPPAIVATDIGKRFGAIAALDGISLTVAAGEIVALIGANGAGKTTLLRVLATTVIPDRGDALVGGHSVRGDARAARRACGLVLGDERSWYWRLSGRRNLEFFAALHGVRRGAAAVRAHELLAEQGLADAADRPVSDYSSGMRLRLSLARALLADPSVLLLDEPTRSLDPGATDAFRAMLAALARERGVSALLATHDLDDARAVCARTLLLGGGRVLAEAPAGVDPADLTDAGGGHA